MKFNKLVFFAVTAGFALVSGNALSDTTSAAVDVGTAKVTPSDVKVDTANIKPVAPGPKPVKLPKPDKPPKPVKVRR